MEQKEISVSDILSQCEEEIPMLQTTVGERRKLESDVFYLLQNFIHTFLAIVVVFTFVGLVTRVSGASMEPTLHDGEVLLVWSLAYEPKAQDIVIITNPTPGRLEGQSIVKRIIAVAGDMVEVDYKNNQVLVNGVPLQENYLNGVMIPVYNENAGIVEVPPDHVYVLGDNRNYSSDSRDPEIGMVHTGYINGKVLCGIWPLRSGKDF